MALGEVDNSSGFAPSESLSSLESVVSYVGGGVVSVRIIPSPPFGYLQVLGMSPPSGSVTLASTPYECQSILFYSAISAQTIWAQLVSYFVPNHCLFVKKVLINLDASLKEVWIVTKLQIGVVGQIMTKVLLLFKCLSNVAPHNVLLTMFICPGL